MPRLAAPVTLNEKIQWLKIRYRDPLLKVCADKVAARGFAERLGDKYLVPIVGVLDRAIGIDFSGLPHSFVLKASHGSGWNVICRDIYELGREEVRRKFERWEKINFYDVGREWAYDRIPPRILCEHFLEGSDGSSPWDYKVFCFHGRARFIQVDYDRFDGHTRCLFDTDWIPLPCELEYPTRTEASEPPENLKELVRVAEELARGFPFVRVDLYEVGEQVFFGEMTFYPGKGVERFRPAIWDVKLSEWLDINSVVSEITTGPDGFFLWPSSSEWRGKPKESEQERV